MKVRDWSGMARYGLPGLILGAAAAWAAGAGGPELSAQTATAQPAASPGVRRAAAPEANGTIALLSAASNVQGPTGAQFLFLVDTDARALAVYRFDPNSPKGSLKLEAARRYEFDLKMDQYNNLAPEPSAIEASLKAAQPGRIPKDR